MRLDEKRGWLWSLVKFAATASVDGDRRDRCGRVVRHRLPDIDEALQANRRPMVTLLASTVRWKLAATFMACHSRSVIYPCPNPGGAGNRGPPVL